VKHARADERAALAEARRPRVQALLPVDVHVEERIEEVEPGDPRGYGGAAAARRSGRRSVWFAFSSFGFAQDIVLVREVVRE